MSSEPRYSTGDDGLPIRPGAQKNCKVCLGYGIVEDGSFHYASVLIGCPKCFPEPTTKGASSGH